MNPIFCSKCLAEQPADALPAGAVVGMTRCVACGYSNIKLFRCDPETIEEERKARKKERDRVSPPMAADRIWLCTRCATEQPVPPPDVCARCGCPRNCFRGFTEQALRERRQKGARSIGALPSQTFTVNAYNQRPQ